MSSGLVLTLIIGKGPEVEMMHGEHTRPLPAAEQEKMAVGAFNRGWYVTELKAVYGRINEEVENLNLTAVWINLCILDVRSVLSWSLFVLWRLYLFVVLWCWTDSSHSGADFLPLIFWTLRIHDFSLNDFFLNIQTKSWAQKSRSWDKLIYIHTYLDQSVPELMPSLQTNNYFGFSSILF